MRKPEYLSPSALSRFENNREDFFKSYISTVKVARQPQLPVMSIGSAFDAYCKSGLYYRAYGKIEPQYTFEGLFERQVEPQNRDFAVQTGKIAYDAYATSGALDDLTTLIDQCDTPPRFEFELRGEIDGVPLLGKPDCQFVCKGVHVILDWKVNGYLSKAPTPPLKFYAMCRDGWVGERQTRGNAKPHPEYIPYDHNGLTIHSGYLEATSNEWADQLTTYAWMLGEAIGDEDVVMAIDQLVGARVEGPLLRVAQFRSRVSKAYQYSLAERYKVAWKAIQTGYIFTDLTEAQNNDKIEALERFAKACSTDPNLAHLTANRSRF
jgi:hypothetical protein